MKNQWIIMVLLLCFCQTLGAQNTSSSFELFYSVAGLGSNMGTTQPTIQIQGTQLVYTFEQNSYYGKRNLANDTILVAEIGQSSIDAILWLLETSGAKGKEIYETNPHIMSGNIVSLLIHTDKDTTAFTLHNACHKIIEVINVYLPSNQQIPLYYYSEDCYSEVEKMKKSWQKSIYSLPLE